jgi:hypothetical protein
MDYSAIARSNYFKVKDHAAFLEFCSKYDLDPWTHKVKDNNGLDVELVGFGANQSGGWDQQAVDPITDEDLQGDIESDLAKLLDEDEVAILMHAGNEGKRYVSGYAVAINSKGKRKEIVLSDIYDKAKKLTKDPNKITLCEY